MDPDELAHQHWTHAQIASGIERVVAQWPYVVTIDLDGVRVALMHYALAGTEGEFAPLVRDTRVGDLDAQFETVDAEAVVFGHLHSSVDVQGRRRYIRPGSLGCHDRPLAPYAILAAHQGELGVTYRAVPYGDAALFEALERRQVPARAFIREVFLRREAPNWPWPY
jgi:predicted phosphodiesterase